MARILVEKDDSSLQTFLSEVLSKASQMVTSCEDREDTIAVLELRKHDLLLCDIVMPGLDGKELAQCATAHLIDIGVLLITGFTAVALNVPQTGSKRSAKILSKLFHLCELIQEVDHVLQVNAAWRRHSPSGTCF